MASSTTIKRTADDKREGLTLDELSSWLTETANAGITPDTSVRVTNGVKGQIKSIEVTG